jgi:lysophospholipase L1-like esterase
LAVKVVVGVFAGFGAIVYLHLVWTRYGPQRPYDALDGRVGYDWAWMPRYRQDDATVRAAGRRPDVVFIGESMTEFWRLRRPGFFRPGFVDRGIAGESSPQMLVRFRQDVIDLHPRVVHIMMGTNDIGGRTGPMTLQQTEANFETMTDLARANGVTVILATTPPTDHVLGDAVKPARTIRALEEWIRGYARRSGAGLADYARVLDDGRGGLRAGLTTGGVHSNAHGYAAMEAIAEPAIQAALDTAARVGASEAPDSVLRRAPPGPPSRQRPSLTRRSPCAVRPSTPNGGREARARFPHPSGGQGRTRPRHLRPDPHRVRAGDRTRRGRHLCDLDLDLPQLSPRSAGLRQDPANPRGPAPRR